MEKSKGSYIYNVGLVHQSGYEVVIQIPAASIVSEKQFFPLLFASLLASEPNAYGDYSDYRFLLGSKPRNVKKSYYTPVRRDPGSVHDHHGDSDAWAGDCGNDFEDLFTKEEHGAFESGGLVLSRGNCESCPTLRPDKTKQKWHFLMICGNSLF